MTTSLSEIDLSVGLAGGG